MPVPQRSPDRWIFDKEGDGQSAGQDTERMIRKTGRECIVEVKSVPLHGGITI
jgi:hypothetical protein